MKCPRCSAPITGSLDEMGLLVCPQCGAKLRSKGGPSKASRDAVSDPETLPARAEAHTGTHGSNPHLTLPPGTPRPRIPTPEEFRRTAPAPPAHEAPPPAAQLEAILAEIRAVREAQGEILDLLRSLPAGAGVAPAAGEDDVPLPPPPVRTRRRKTVLLIDDDETTRRAAETAMERAEIPVRATGDGHGSLAAISAEKPDVLVMELGLSGSMGGKDVINMIKATMEWIDIPIILYTRIPVDGQKEARTVHGADEYLPKSAGPDALVAKVISLFRKA